MSNPVYKMIEITGTSEKSSDEAIQNGIARAAKTVRHMNWFEVIETRGRINADNVVQWQVTLKIGFALDD